MWKDKNVWILLIGEFIAGIGLWLGIIGDLEFMQDKVPSDFLKSIILATGLLAGLTVGPLAGRVIDQMRKKTVMLLSGFVRTLSVIFMFIAIETGSVWWMITFLILIEICAAFYFPALQAAIPLVVKEEKLLQVNGIYMNVSSISRIIGTASAGILLVIISLSMLCVLPFIAYLGLFILTCFLTINESKKEKTILGDIPSPRTGFKDVFPIIKEQPIVLMTLTLSFVPLFFLGGFNLVVMNISELQNNASIKGWIYTAEAIAVILGTFSVKQISRKCSPYTILFLCSFVIGFSQLLLYFAQIPVLSIIVFLLFGFSVEPFSNRCNHFSNERTERLPRSKFLLPFRIMLDVFIFQVVLIMTGLLLDIMGLQHMSVSFGILSLTMTSIYFVQFRKRRTQFKMKAEIS